VGPDDDPAEALLSYADQLFNNAIFNYNTAMELRAQVSQQEDKVIAAEQHLSEARAEVKRLKHEVENSNNALAAVTADLDESEASVADQTSRLKQLQKENETLSQDLQQKQEEMDWRLRESNGRLAAVEESAEAKIDQQRWEFEDRLDAKREEINDLQKRDQRQLQQMEEDHSQTLRRREEQKKQNGIHSRDGIVSLEGGLVEESHDFRPATDGSLKTRYGHLKLAVEAITDPQTLGIRTMPQSARLDPTGFLRRQRGALPHLLRSLVWSRLMNGFFSAPFGFGALGAESGKSALLDLYHAWRKVFDADWVSGRSPKTGGSAHRDEFAVFRNDKEANKWRSATFQPIIMAASPKGHKGGQHSADGTVQVFIRNCDKVHGEICGILEEVCPNGTREHIEVEVYRIVNLAGELSLEFGSQSALLGLHGPKRGERVQIGSDFIDCQDKNAKKDYLEEVDLMVSPKLYKVGDRRNDLKTKRSSFLGRYIQGPSESALYLGFLEKVVGEVEWCPQETLRQPISPLNEARAPKEFATWAFELAKSRESKTSAHLSTMLLGSWPGKYPAEGRLVDV